MPVRLAIFASVAALVAASPAAAERFPAKSIQLLDITGSVEIVTTGAGEEVEVVISQGKTNHPVVLSVDAAGLVTVKGEKWKEEDTRDCCNDRIRRTFEARHGREA
ncbi:MAG: hypothetical protein WD076_11435, partial [Parvularculaceae bacterium]